MKEKIVSIIQIIGVICWCLAILIGGYLGHDGSIVLGLLMGFSIGAGIGTLLYMLGTIIKKPYLLFSFITIPIGYIIGLLWGDVGSLLGMYFGVFLAFILLLKFHDQEF